MGSLSPEEIARKHAPSVEGLWAAMIPFTARAIRESVQQAREEALEEAAKKAKAVADDYDDARERFSGRPDASVARKYSDMRDGALATEKAIRSLNGASARPA